MRKIPITITIILLGFCFYAIAQKYNAAKENIPKESPDILVVEYFSDQYGPVRFKHQLHSQPMTSVGMECSDCHHYSPPGDFPPCSKCHSAKRGEINSIFPVNRPTIEGAYHRQCINCHREWNPSIIECSSCHLEKITDEPNRTGIAVTETVGEHPVIEAPDRRIYETRRYKDTMVTFLHKEHTELFEVDCLDCHGKGGTCSYCHGSEIEETEKETVITSEERHESCISCHSSWIVPSQNIDTEQYCQKCHTKTQQQKFDHGQSTGWPLEQYHVELSCDRCHIPKGEFGKLATECDVCHRGWNPQNFNHSVTGVVLDDNHREIDCDYCHPERKFDKEVSCSDCHGEDIKYPNDLPGPSPNDLPGPSPDEM